MSRVALLPDRTRPLIFAHRGCSSLAPENTFAAFKKAREIGAPGIELDIHASKDGKLVVAHDDTFVRTAPEGNNGGGKLLEDLLWDEIKNIDVGSFFSRDFSGCHPPLIEEVLEEFCPAMYVDIELKSRKMRGDPLPALFAGCLERMGPKIAGAVTVSSFNPLCLGAFKTAWRRCVAESGGGLPDIATAVIYSVDDEVPWILRRGFGRHIAHCDYVKPMHNLVTGFSRFIITTLEKRPMVPWTVDYGNLAQKMTEKGCDGFITNRPQDLL